MPYFLDYWETIPASTLADDPISFNALSSRDGAGNTINTLTSVTGATALDLAQGNVQHISSTSGNYTLGTPSGGLTGKDRTFMLVIDTTTTGHTPTFFGSLTWSTGAEPTITWTGSTRQMFQFWTVDGTNWLGWHLTGPAAISRVSGGASIEDIGAIESNVQTVAATGSTETLDTSVYGMFDMTMDQNCTFTFSNPAPSGKATMFTLILRGAFVPTWPAAVDWPDGSAPTYTTPSVYTFLTVNAGTAWFGTQAGKAFA